MTSIRILIAAVLTVLGGTAAAQVSTASNAPQPNYNDPAYWETRTEHPAVCYDHVGNSAHGSLTDAGKAVTLAPFGATWPGDHWELLVVKSGSVDAGDGNGPGNKVYPHPSAGTAYYGPRNAGGEQGTVSHWIVCKGTAPQSQTTQVSWVATDGDCDVTTGTLAVGYDPTAVEYQGDAPGTYAAGVSVTGKFVAKQGFVIAGAAGPYSHTFAVDGEPCERPADLRLTLTPECAVGDTLHWRVDNDHDVDVAFTWDGPGGDGAGLAPAGSHAYFTTTATGGDDTTQIRWTNPSGGPSQTASSPDDAPCVDHVVFAKRWDGDAAPDLDGAVLLTASSSIGTAECTSDDGSLTCTYTAHGASADDLHVPFGETYAVVEHVPAGWYTVNGIGTGFPGIAGFDPAALPSELVPVGADDRFCTAEAEASARRDTGCTHVVTNAPTDSAPAPSFVDPTCADRSVAVVDPNPDDGVTYEVVAGEVAPGQTVTVRAVAAQGIVLVGTTEWSHTFGEVTDAECLVPGTPASSLTSTCGAATLTFGNTVGELPEGFTGAPIDFTYSVDGEATTVTVGPGATETVELEFDEDSGVHTVAIGDDEPTLVESNCEPDVAVPAAPSFVDPTCAAPDTVAVVLPVVAGVTYDTTGTPAPGATVTVTAAAAPGYVLAGTAAWSHTFATVDTGECTTTTTTTTTVESGGPTTTTTVASGAIPTTTTTTTTTAAAPTTTTVRRLPSTGSDGTAPLAALGVALIGLGLLLGAAVRRPRPS